MAHVSRGPARGTGAANELPARRLSWQVDARCRWRFRAKPSAGGAPAAPTMATFRALSIATSGTLRVISRPARSCATYLPHVSVEGESRPRQRSVAEHVEAPMPRCADALPLRTTQQLPARTHRFAPFMNIFPNAEGDVGRGRLALVRRHGQEAGERIAGLARSRACPTSAPSRNQQRTPCPATGARRCSGTRCGVYWCARCAALTHSLWVPTHWCCGPVALVAPWTSGDSSQGREPGTWPTPHGAPRGLNCGMFGGWVPPSGCMAR